MTRHRHRLRVAAPATPLPEHRIHSLENLSVHRCEKSMPLPRKR
jgi:hypothetical protein